MRPGRPGSAPIATLFAALVATACGGASPTGPSGAIPNERVSGVWVGKATLSAVSGGECVGATLQSAIGARDLFAASVRQDGNVLGATIAYQGNRTSCEFDGTRGPGTVRFTATACHAARVEGFGCANGGVRDLEMITARVEADAVDGTGTGRDVSTWNVFEQGGRTSLAALTLTAEFRWNLSRLPHSDFHIFDGSILPGYVDGVVTIPAEPDPFCIICGWFAR